MKKKVIKPEVIDADALIKKEERKRRRKEFKDNFQVNFGLAAKYFVTGLGIGTGLLIRKKIFR